MAIDNGKKSHSYLVVGCSYPCFPFVHQMFCEPGVIGKGARLRLIIFSPQSARHLQTSAKLFSLPICNPSATHFHFSWSSSRHGRRWTRLINWTVTISATCRSQDSSPIFLLSPPTKSSTGPLPRNFQDIMPLISIFLLPPGIVQWADSWQSPANLERRLEATYHPLRRDIRCRW